MRLGPEQPGRRARPGLRAPWRPRGACALAAPGCVRLGDPVRACTTVLKLGHLDKTARMRLLEQAAFEFRESDFPVDAQTPCSLLTGEPADGRPVQIPRGPSGRAWRAQRAGRPFTVTVEEGHAEALSHVLQQCSRLPLPYLAALEIVSEAGEDGLALYQSLGGASGHGSENYVNVVGSALPLLLHEFGHAIEQQARNRGNAGFLDE